MNTAVFVLLFFAHAFPTATRQYVYDQVEIREDGWQNFKTDTYELTEAKGCLSLGHGQLRIGEEVFRLKPTKLRHQYRIPGGRVQLIYKNQRLSAVRLVKYRQVFLFHIAGESSASQDAEIVLAHER